jgi:hypothetical protein
MTMIIGFSLSGALTLYWVVMSALTVLQQWYMLDYKKGIGHGALGIGNAPIIGSATVLPPEGARSEERGASVSDQASTSQQAPFPAKGRDGDGSIPAEDQKKNEEKQLFVGVDEEKKPESPDQP